MGLLDPTLLRNLKGLTGLLAETPIGKYVRGKDQGVSVEGLKRGLLSIPVFENTPEANQTAYEAAMNIGPLGLGKIVYHGSPHKFDKFDASKIGTGEGAQAYGHGVYLADSEGVAKSYKDAGSGFAVDGLRDYGVPQETALEQAKRWLKYQEINPTEMHHFRVAEPKTFSDEIVNDIIDGKVKRGGSLYKADLPDEWIPKMLDWDKPLSQQSPEVQAAFLKAQAGGDKLLSELLDLSPSGMQLQGMIPTAHGAAAYKTMAEQMGGHAKAANALRQAGIPGIRYLDGGSRGKGQGSYNYVVFPGLEDQVKILERNGVPLGLLGK